MPSAKSVYNFLGLMYRFIVSFSYGTCSLFLLNVLLNTKQLTNHSGPFKISFVADGHSTAQFSW